MFGKRLSASLFCIFFVVVTFIACADQEMPNRPYVKASAYGNVYAKCFPDKVFVDADTGEVRGRTEVFRITEKSERQLCSFDWYSDQIYIADTGNNDGEEAVLVKMGAWPQGQEPNETWLAIAFYKGCKEVKRYSTADIVRLGYKDPRKVPRSASHYTVFGPVKGFRIRTSPEYVFDLETAEGAVLSFNASTGVLRTVEDEEAEQGRQRDFFNKMCDMSQGNLVQEPQKDGTKNWVCKNPDGGFSNFGPVISYVK